MVSRRRRTPLATPQAIQNTPPSTSGTMTITSLSALRQTVLISVTNSSLAPDPCKAR